MHAAKSVAADGFHLDQQPGLSLLKRTLPFARADRRKSYLQVMGTILLFVSVVAAVRHVSFAFAACAIPLLGLTYIRLFVLEHDCGHNSLFPSTVENVFWGRTLGFLTGVAYDGWKHEHNWHHSAVGIMEKRGVDRMNSPLTVEEARSNPEKAARMLRKISPLKVAVLGAYSLLVERKRAAAFFMFRPAFRWPNPFRSQIIRNLVLTNAVHAALQLGYLWYLGPTRYFLVFLPAIALGAMIGASLFWVQHNFEESYLAPQADWSYVDAALKGSSYLRLPRILAWFTADIGLHHVHHLNPRIPNYRLEDVRVALHELRCIPPLLLSEIPACYTKLFWDARLGRKVAIPELVATPAHGQSSCSAPQEQEP